MKEEKPLLVSKAPLLKSTILPVVFALIGCLGVFKLLFTTDTGSGYITIPMFAVTILLIVSSRSYSLKVYDDKLIITYRNKATTIPLSSIKSWEETSDYGQGFRTILYTENTPRDSYSFSVEQFSNYQELKDVLTRNKPIEEY